MNNQKPDDDSTLKNNSESKVNDSTVPNNNKTKGVRCKCSPGKQSESTQVEHNARNFEKPSGVNRFYNKCNCPNSYQNCTPPPPPQGGDDDWDLQFCRWWGWNWVQKRQDALPRSNYTNKPDYYSSHIIKKKRKKNFFENICQNLCFPRKQTSSPYRPDLKKFYDTPCVSSAVVSKHRGWNRRNFCSSSFAPKRMPSRSRSRRGIKNRQPRRCQKELSYQMPSSSSEEYYRQRSQGKMTSPEDSIEYLSVRMEHASSDCNCSEQYALECCCKRPPCCCNNLNNLARSRRSGKTQTLPVKHVKSCKCTATQTAEQKKLKAKKKCMHFVCHPAKKCCAACCPCMRTCACHCRCEQLPNDKSPSKNFKILAKGSSGPQKTVPLHSTMLDNYASNPTVPMQEPWVLNFRTDYNKMYKWGMPENFCSPISGKTFNLSASGVAVANGKARYLPDPIDPEDDIKYLKSLNKFKNSDVEHRLLLDAVCEALLANNKGSDFKNVDNKFVKDCFYNFDSKDTVNSKDQVFNCHNFSNVESILADYKLSNARKKNRLGYVENNRSNSKQICTPDVNVISNQNLCQEKFSNEYVPPTYDRIFEKHMRSIGWNVIEYKRTPCSDFAEIPHDSASSDNKLQEIDELLNKYLNLEPALVDDRPSIQEFGVNTSFSALPQIKPYTDSDCLKDSGVNTTINSKNIGINTAILNGINSENFRTEVKAENEILRFGGATIAPTFTKTGLLCFQSSDHFRTFKRSTSSVSGRLKAKRMRPLSKISNQSHSGSTQAHSSAKHSFTDSSASGSMSWGASNIFDKANRKMDTDKSKFKMI